MLSHGVFYTVVLNIFCLDDVRVCEYLGKEVNQSVALESCDNGLASYQDIKDLGTIPSDLADCASVWTSGYLTYSNPILLLGCFMRTYRFTLTPEPLTHHGSLLYTCCKHCGEFDYFATHGDNCYCLELTDIRQLFQNDTNCNVEPSAMIQPNYINYDNYYMVYKIEAFPEKGHRQCNLLGYSSTYIWANSCHSARKDIKKLLFTCEQTNVDNSAIDFYYNKSVSWTKALKICLDISSVLSPFSYIITEYEEWQWEPYFKPYKIVQELNVRDSVDNVGCLAVTKLNGTLYLDPDSCGAIKHVYCAPTLKDRAVHVSTESGDSIKSQVVSFQEGSTKRQNTPFQHSTPNSQDINVKEGNSILPYVYVVSSLAIIILNLVVTWCCFRRKRNNFINTSEEARAKLPNKDHNSVYYLHPAESEEHALSALNNHSGCLNNSTGSHYTDINDDKSLKTKGISKETADASSTYHLQQTVETEKDYMYLHPVGNPGSSCVTVNRMNESKPRKEICNSVETEYPYVQARFEENDNLHPVENKPDTVYENDVLVNADTHIYEVPCTVGLDIGLNDHATNKFHTKLQPMSDEMKPLEDGNQTEEGGATH